MLAAASTDTGSRPGPADIAGLYDRRDDGYRAGVYESAYRPGLYVADRDEGRVVPQFLHLHPILIAWGRLAFASDSPAPVVVLVATLGLLAFAAVARRIWPRGPWAPLATSLIALSPVLIWTHRVPLSEGPMFLFALSAWLSLLRARDSGDHGDVQRALTLVGLMTWTRGNAWLFVPVVLLVGLARQRQFVGRRAFTAGPWPLLALFCTSVAVHVATGFPYVHDELMRRLPSSLRFGPVELVVTACLGAAIWLVVDLALSRAPHSSNPVAARMLAECPRLLALVAGCAITFYVAGRWSTEFVAPYSRLDPALPTLGGPVIVLAAIGALWTSLRWQPRPGGAWLVALASIPTMTLVLYAGRGLPKLELFYYARYLVPELLPAATIAAVAAVAHIHQLLKPRSKAAATATAAVLFAGLVWSVAGHLLAHPSTRFREFAEAETAVDWLDDHLPEDAIVIAGGEGWHHGHTHNQVGGALALGRGRTVVPYRSQEACYATLHELLISEPAHAGRDGPRVFVLLNEATHNYETNEARGDAQRTIAGFDDQLPPPFAARNVGVLELFVHGLTATRDRIPHRVTRHELRMALFEVVVDPSRAGEQDVWRLASAASDDGESLTLSEHRRSDGGVCLSATDPLVVTVPPAGPASADPTSVVLVAAPGTDENNHRWRVEADGQPLSFTTPKISPRARDTLGPYLLERRPQTLSILGVADLDAAGPCEHGTLSELRLLRHGAGALDQEPVDWAVSLTRQDDLGKPFVTSDWVAARSLNRFRPGTTPTPDISGMTMRLSGGESLGFAPMLLPAAGERPVDLVVTITGSQLAPGSRLRILADDSLLVELDPPDSREASWSSPPLAWSPTRATVRVRAELVGAHGEHWVGIRDIAFFARGQWIEATQVTVD